MAQLLQFPISPRFIPNDREAALVAAVDIVNGYPENGLSAGRTCAELLGLPEIGSRLALGDRAPEFIENAGDALDLIALALEQHYVEGLAAADVCRQLVSLMERPEIIEIYDSVLARRPAGIRDSELRH
jgi:hypothetical protein